MIVRKMANKTSLEVDITQDGDHFIIITKTGPSTTKWDFMVGTQYETDGAGGSGKVTVSLIILIPGLTYCHGPGQAGIKQSHYG